MALTESGWIPDSRDPDNKDGWLSSDCEHIEQRIADDFFSILEYQSMIHACLEQLRELKKQGHIETEDFESFLNNLREGYWPKDSKNPL